jgi:4'-phosphopantetheinyl transferase
VTPLALDSVQPPHHQLHLWLLDFTAVRSLASRMQLVLNDEERARSRNIRDESRRTQFTRTRSALRIILQSYGIGAAPDIQLTRGPTGKPQLLAPYPKHLHFNVSYRENVALLAFTDLGDIGVDIEQLRPFPLAAQIINDTFADEERAAFDSIPADKKLEAFYAGWTRKEAYLKATGAGLGTPLSSFAVTILPADQPRLLRVEGAPAEHLNWQLFDVPAPSHYRATAALRSTSPVELTLFSFAKRLKTDVHISSQFVAVPPPLP